MDNLVVAARSLGSVGEKFAELGQKRLPVAGNVLHTQVVEDEFLPPVEVRHRVSHQCLSENTSGIIIKLNMRSELLLKLNRKI